MGRCKTDSESKCTHAENIKNRTSTCPQTDCHSNKNNTLNTIKVSSGPPTPRQTDYKAFQLTVSRRAKNQSRTVRQSN
eukprot:3139544-Amphidinium_carterae.1